MPGRVQQLVASIVIEGVRAAAPRALADAELVEAVLAPHPDGVPLGPYRRLLDAALEHDGGLALLQCGGPLRTLTHPSKHPLLFVLLNTDSPRLLIEKEARLAAFFHSRHRVIIEAEGVTSLTLRHVGPADEPPEPAEDLATLGQHIPLFEEIGCRDLRARLPESGAPDAWVYEDGLFARPTPGGSYAAWHLEWSSYAATRKPMPGLDEVLLASVTTAQLREDQSVAAKVEVVIRRDLGRTWRIAEVAEALGSSVRSLQRALAADGERYSELVDEIRNREAVRLLRETTFSLTEIGYVCGFADSAHFSRSFKKRHGVAPSEYRARAGAPDDFA